MVDSLGLQVEQITLPQDVTTNCVEVMVMHMLQWTAVAKPTSIFPIPVFACTCLTSQAVLSDYLNPEYPISSHRSRCNLLMESESRMTTTFDRINCALSVASKE